MVIARWLKVKASCLCFYIDTDQVNIETYSNDVIGISLTSRIT